MDLVDAQLGLDDLARDREAQRVHMPQCIRGDDAGAALAVALRVRSYEVARLVDVDAKLNPRLPGQRQQVQGGKASRRPATDNSDAITVAQAQTAHRPASVPMLRFPF